MQAGKQPGEGKKAKPQIAFICDDEFPEHCAADIRKGEAAPFNGVLYTKALAASLAVDVEASEERSSIEIKYTNKACAIELKRESDLRNIDSKLCSNKIEILQAALDEREAWYRQPMFVAITTVIVTFGLVGVTGYALHSVN